MYRAAGLVIVVLLSWVYPALADELVVQWTGEEAESFEYLTDHAHFTVFYSPEGWPDVLCSEVQFFARRFGDTENVFGTVVVYGPPEDTGVFRGGSRENRLSVLARNQFMLADVPEDGGWITVGVAPFAVGSEFAVAVYTYSSEDRGVKLGLAPTTGEESQSGTFRMTKVKTPDEITTTDHYTWRGGSMDWMIRARVGSTVSPDDVVDASAIEGPGYAYLDDGSAEGFYTSQKNGPLVRFSNDGGRVVDEVYVHAHLVGDWFETDRAASVYLLDRDLRILQRKRLKYSDYATEPSWGLVNFDSIAVTADFFVLVEPISRPDVQMMIGCDESGENLGSQWGTAGSVLAWGSEAPEESANWMVRVHYEQ